ncbi:MAG TPA: RCC1 domain-containing protein, partial [Polyangia bacterium]|nr:RCC1 domain-containing protein [Polyangia bacterium]
MRVALGVAVACLLACGRDELPVAGDGGATPAGPAPLRALAVAAGASHSCALLESHRVKCWGKGAAGQLGYGDGYRRGSGPGQMGNGLPFVDLGTGRTATAIAAGGDATCAILDDGSVKCWGDGALTGQPGADDVGDGPGEMGDALPALDLGAGRAATRLVVSSRNACALLDDATARCWGADAPA